MPYIGFGRADIERSVGGAVRAENGTQRADFDGIAQRGAGAVRLYEVDLGGRQSGLAQGLAHDALLRGPAGHGQTAAGPVLIGRRSADDGQDGVAVGLCVGQALEHHRTASFRAHIAVGGGVEGFAVAVAGQHTGGGKVDADLRVEQQVDAGAQRQVGFAVAQALAGQMHRQQRRRTGRVHHGARSGQPQGVRDPPGRRAEQGSGAAVGTDLRRVLAAELTDRIVHRTDADKNTGTAAVEPVGRNTSVFQRLPNHFQ